MPRGAIQLRNSFSRQFSLVPMADRKMLIGRATSIRIASTRARPQPSSAMALNSTRAARMMNSAEISRTLSDSLNSRMLSIGTCFMLAIQIPITVTVSRPDSCAISFDRA